MKKLTKVLSLVLVIAMMVSLCVVGVSAKSDFADQKDVTDKYVEAVDVMSEIGIIEGTGNGFEPAGTFTRGAAAKIITYMQLGVDGAKALTGKATFADSVNHWATTFIAYCAQQGIVNGYNAQKFGPDDTLTGYQWTKMLLCAVGYGVNKEYVGANWALNAARDGMKYGVYTANADVLAGSTGEVITREVATAMAFNALTGMAKVTYSALVGDYINGTGLSVNGVTTTGTLGETVFALNNTAWYTAANNTLGMGEQPLVYDTDKFVVTNGDFTFQPNNADYTMAGRSGHAWYTVNGYGRQVAASDFYPTDTLLYTNTESNVNFAGLTTKTATTYKVPANTGCQLFVNGDATGAAAANYAFARGAEASFYDYDADGKADVVLYFPKTTDVVGANGVAYNATKTTATVDGIVTAYTKVEALDNFAELVANDVVLWWQDVTGVTHFQKLDPTVAQLSKTTVLSNGEIAYRIGDADQLQSGICFVGLSIPGEGYDVDVNYYYDDYGYIVYAKAVASALSDYVVLLDLGTEVGNVFAGNTAYAQILKMDGTTENVKIDSIVTDVANKTTSTSVYLFPNSATATTTTLADKSVVKFAATPDAAADAQTVLPDTKTAATADTEGAYVYRFYTYTVNAAGKYILTPVELSTSVFAKTTPYAVVGNVCDQSVAFKAAGDLTGNVVNGISATNAGTTVYANNSTVYLYKNAATDKYVAVTGYTKAPATDAGSTVVSAAYTVNGTVANFVFIDGTVNTAVAADALFFANPELNWEHGANRTTGAPVYYEYQVIDTTGTLTTVNVATGVAVAEGFGIPTYTTFGDVKIVTALAQNNYAAAAQGNAAAVFLPTTQYGIGRGASDTSVIMVGGDQDIIRTASVKDYNYSGVTPAFVVNKDATNHAATLDTNVTTAGAIQADINDIVYVVPVTGKPHDAKAIYIIKVDEPAVTVAATATPNEYAVLDAATQRTPVMRNCAITYAWYLNGNTTPIVGANTNTITQVLGATDKLVCKVTYTNAVTGATFTAQSGKATVPTEATFGATAIDTVSKDTITFNGAVGAACTATVTIVDAANTVTVVNAAANTLAATATSVPTGVTLAAGTYRVTVVLTDATGVIAPATLTWYGTIAA